MNQDITKTSLAVLLVMAMVISVLGTLTVIKAYESTKMPSVQNPGPTDNQNPHQGTVSFSIVPPSEKQTVSDSGTISFSITKGDNQ